MQQNVNHTKHEDCTNEIDLVFQDKKTGVSVLLLLVKHYADDAIICVDIHKRRATAGLRQHNAAPSGSPWKYIETSHRH